MKRKKLRKCRQVSFFMALAVAMSGITGCGQQETTKVSQSLSSEESLMEQKDSGSSTQNEITINPLSSSSVDTEFSDRDIDSSYSESEAVTITLNGSQIQSSNENVMISGAIATIIASGTYIISGSLENGQIIVEASDTDKIQIVLNDAVIHCETSAAIYIKKADKVFLTLAPNTENCLSGGSQSVAIDDNTIDGVVFSKEDLTINGNGTLEVDADYKHGIVSKDTLAVTGGTIIIDSISQCLSAKDGIKILDGTFTLSTQGKALKAENTDDTAFGNIYVAGGEFTVKSADDAFHAGGSLVIDGGNFLVDAGDDAFHGEQDLVINSGEIKITNCYEGLEGYRVTINGGFISLKASDDGINGAGPTSSDKEAAPEGNHEIRGEILGEDNRMTKGQRPEPDGSRGGQKGPGGAMENDTSAYINITGGTIIVDAGGDGLDSNGSLYISGGTTYVSGSEGGGDGALDYNGEGIITGGIVIAAGSASMAQGFSQSSTQHSILQNLSNVQEAGSEIALTASDGTVLAVWQPVKNYSSVAISCPGLNQNETYTLTTGTESANLVLESMVTSNGRPAQGQRFH